MGGEILNPRDIRLQAVPSPGLSPANEAFIYFDKPTLKLKYSVNGGAYADLGAVAGSVTTAGGTANTLPVWATPTTLADSGLTDDGSTVSVNRASMTIGTSNVIANFANATPSILLGAGSSSLEINDATHVITLTASSGVILPTVTTGVWHGTVVEGLYGGTGVANSGKTITLGGNLVTLGAFATTITSTATTNSTLPAGTHNLAPLDSPAFSGTPSGPSYAINGTGGLGFSEFPTQSSAPTAPASGYREYADSTGRQSWIRASDGFTRTWDATLTANRVYGLFDASDTLVGLAVAQALTNKTINGNTFTAGTYTLTGTAAKTLNFTNTLTLAGTDGSTLNIGAGGTLGTGAFAAAGANTALSNLASVAINTDLLPASTQGLGNASFPFLASFIGNTTQYESVSQSAGLLAHTLAGSASNIGLAFIAKGSTTTGNISFTVGGAVVLNLINQSQDGLILRSDGGYYWASSTLTQTSATPDTSVYRSSAGVVGFGTTANNSLGSWLATNGTLSNTLTLGTAAARSGTAGTNRLDIFNGTAPTGTLTNGASFYVSGGEMFTIDAGGTATQLSSHDKDGYLIYNTHYTTTGKRVVIDAEKLLRFLNSYFGTDFVHEYLEVKQ